MMSYGSQTERRWHLCEDEAEPIVRRAVEAGVTFFDTADTYSDGLTEEITGRLLAKAFGRRDDYVLATKVFFPMVWVPKTHPAHATRVYSWIAPPRRSSRRIRWLIGGAGWGRAPSGGAWPRERCGRCSL
jgi:aryl-alcohol dehydrogenase-like predicted oxidoreductase